MTITEGTPTIRAEVNEQIEASANSFAVLVINAVLVSQRDGSRVFSELSADSAGLEVVQGLEQLGSGIVESHHGEVIKEIGGSVIVEFGSAAAAVRAAVEIERLWTDQ